MFWFDHAFWALEVDPISSPIVRKLQPSADKLVLQLAAQGARFLAGLRSIRAETIREVRGRGLMLAVELHPEAGDARRYCEALQSRGILAKDTHGHTIRIAPLAVGGQTAG